MLSVGKVQAVFSPTWPQQQIRRPLPFSLIPNVRCDAACDEQGAVDFAKQWSSLWWEYYVTKVRKGNNGEAYRHFLISNLTCMAVINVELPYRCAVALDPTGDGTSVGRIWENGTPCTVASLRMVDGILWRQDAGAL